MFFVAQRLRYDWPKPVAEHFKDDRVWNAYVNHDKNIILVGFYGSWVLKGDWFKHPVDIDKEEEQARKQKDGVE